MKYEAALEQLNLLSCRGSVPGLEAMEDLLQVMGHPERQLQFVHITGTNGKGSVAAFVSEALCTQGYKVGRYTSPAVCDYRERITYCRKPIPKTAVAEGLSLIFQLCDAKGADFRRLPTVFEMETALAFWYFARKKCDIVVLEVGMGGRLDATNCIPTPKVAILTSVSMDHMSYLGDDLTAIASEKAGILKKGCIAVSAVQEDEVTNVIRDKCDELHIPLRIADVSYIRGLKEQKDKQVLTYQNHKNIAFHLLGTYQQQNAILALEALDALSECGFGVKEDKLKEAFSHTEWFGRFSIVSRKPLVIVDGAHNEAAAKKLAETIRFYFTNRKIVFIMGVLKDKEYDRIIRQVSTIPNAVITITPPIRARALSALELANEWCHYHSSVTAADSVSEALELAELLVQDDGVIICFGSLSYLSEVKQKYEQHHERHK